jgi:Ca2+-binding EF-hand superfamily protein
MKETIALVAWSGLFVSGLSNAQARADARSPADLTRQQAIDRADRLFQTFDRNHDGVLTREEARSVGTRLLVKRAATGRDVAPGIGGHTLRFLEHAFSGMEGVTQQQFEQAMLAHFDEMDVDHDGVLTTTERGQGEAATAPR